jgi:uncharacterized protein
MDLIQDWKNDKNKSSSTAKNILNSDAIKQIPNLDQVIDPLNEEIVSAIDCLGCGNCCKTTVTTFTSEDISKAANFLSISKKKFERQYLILDMGEYTTITTPCPFLQPDNKCKIYEVRPHACSSFPHTQRKNFISRRKSHENNFVICPITYHLIKKLETIGPPIEKKYS